MQNKTHIVIDVLKQELSLVTDGKTVWRRPVSTSSRGLGVEVNSMKTPTGHFRIAEKIGGEHPTGTIFRSRRPVGHWPSLIPEGLTGDSDLVLSRILWLDGLDDDNKSTYDRYIYIHGTNHEERLGTPASCGCIRMANNDIVELFDMVDADTPVNIVV